MPSPTARTPASAALHLSYLDGLRGLAALYVTFTHTIGQVWSRADAAAGFPAWLRSALTPFIWGGYAVDIFIVLSGYCLMLPVVRSADGRLRGGWTGYLGRRARRILPAYYAAVALSLLLAWIVPGLRTGIGTEWDAARPMFSPRAILSHVFLWHNWSLVDNYRINAPLWTVATECQIYLFFPALLLPLWRRGGPLVAAVAGVLVGLVPYALLPVPRPLPACPHFLGLFALGMAGAAVSYSARAREARWRETVGWGALAAGCAAWVIGVSWAGGTGWVLARFPLVDTTLGFGVAALLVFCTRSLRGPAGEGSSARQPWVVRALGARGTVALGGLSYSLYLIHWPLLAVLHVPLLRAGVGPLASFVVLTLLGVPLIVLCAEGFSRIFERSFQRGRRGG